MKCMELAERTRSVECASGFQRCAGVFLALALTLVASPRPVAAQQGVEQEAFAPVLRWTTGGGCGARSGRSLSPPLVARPEVAWQVTLRGPIEGEPRVWDGIVVVSVNEGPQRRAIQVLELSTGRTLLHQPSRNHAAESTQGLSQPPQGFPALRRQIGISFVSNVDSLRRGAQLEIAALAAAIGKVDVDDANGTAQRPDHAVGGRQSER